MDPVTASALIGLGGNFLSGIFGSSSQFKANSTNLKIAQMNNEFNERMLQKQMDYNTDMWNKQNDYNSPSNQVARLKAAGLNPALALGNISTGSAQSVGGINPPTATPVSVQPNTAMATAIGQGIETFLNYKMAKERHDAEIKQINIENQYRARMLMAEIAQKYNDARSKDARARLDETMRGLQPQIAQADIDLKNQTARAQASVAELNTAEKLLKDKELANFDARWDVEKSLAVAQTLQYGALTKLTKQQLLHEVQKTIKTSYEAKGQKISNDTSKRMSEAIVDKAYQDVSLAPWQVGSQALSTLLGGTIGFGFGRLGRHLDKVKSIKGFGK